MTIVGPIDVELWVSTDHADAHFAVKVVDVSPGKATGPSRVIVQELARPLGEQAIPTLSGRSESGAAPENPPQSPHAGSSGG